MSYVALSFLSPPSPLFPVSSLSPPVSASLSPVPSGMLGPFCLGFRGLAIKWAAPQR